MKKTYHTPKTTEGGGGEGAGAGGDSGRGSRKLDSAHHHHHHYQQQYLSVPGSGGSSPLGTSFINVSNNKSAPSTAGNSKESIYVKPTGTGPSQATAIMASVESGRLNSGEPMSNMKEVLSSSQKGKLFEGAPATKKDPTTTNTKRPSRKTKKGDDTNEEIGRGARKSGRSSGNIKKKACVLWQGLTPAGSIPPRWGHTTCVLGNRLYLFGGTGNRVYGECFIYDLSSNSWHMLNVPKGSPPNPRFGHSCVRLSASSKKLMLFGGRGAGNKHYNDMYILNTEKLTWKRYSPTKSTPDSRAGHTVTPFVDGSLVLFGGQTKGQRYLNTIHTFQPETKTWLKGKELGDAPPPRGGHSAVAYNRSLLVFGGFNGRKYFNDLFCYDTETSTWRELPTTGRAPAPRSGHSCTVIRDFMIVFGGCASNSNFLNDVSVLDLETLEWQQASVKGPSLLARFRHTATLVGQSEVYIFGGSGSGVLFSDMAIMHFDVKLVPLGLSRNASQRDINGAPNSPLPTITNHLASPNDQLLESSDSSVCLTVPPSSCGAPLTSSGDGEPIPAATAATRTETIPAEAQLPSQRMLTLPSLPNGKIPTVEEVMHMYLGMAMSLRAEKQQREQLEQVLFKYERAIAADKEAKMQLESKRATIEGELICVQDQIKVATKARVNAERSLKLERKKNKKDGANNDEVVQRMKSGWQEEKEALNARAECAERKCVKKKDKLVRLRAEIGRKTALILELRQEIARLGGAVAHSSPEVSPEPLKKNETKDKERTQEIRELTEQLKKQRVQIRQLTATIEQLKAEQETKAKTVPTFDKMSMEDMEEMEDFYHNALKGVGLAKQVLLRKQLEELKRAKEVLEDAKLCSVCCDAEIRMVLIPCGHRNLCKPCSEILAKCPLCRSEITQRIESF
eukprot:TRINITY_DN7935_c0_g2_i1.p1 TRINITY_DN7935_c0_g2~~TRINITY_DN7935_c0_g2_i1.p1  ORF type:complete len:906 (-),score=187.75 TRINITY_DN7935_c0_g2_i1:160-2877(-)